MAEHKVPQDVEAEDKLLGPLSFRQFIYAMIALGAAALAYFLATNIALPFGAIPLPVFLVFGTLSIPRKGQPMEVYIGALIHFYFQPTRRVWDPDGQDTLVEITNPSIDTTPQIKDVGGAEAAQRLSFLADLEDTQGWSTKIGNANLNDDFAAAATMATDVFDDTSLNNEFDARLAQAEQQVRDEAIARMNTAAVMPVEQNSSVPPPTVMSPVEDEAALSAMLKQSAANNSMTTFQQTVIQPPNPTLVVDNPTLTTTATPITPATMPEPPIPAPTPQQPTPMPEPRPEPAHEPTLEPASIPEPSPAPSLEPEPESDIMETDNNTTNISAEEIISHDAGISDDNQSGEISLH
jgi:hypothetical protein